MWRLLKTKLNNFSFSKHKVEDKEKCPYMEFIEEQEKVDYENWFLVKERLIHTQTKTS